MIEIVAKMAVNSRIRISVPGKEILAVAQSSRRVAAGKWNDGPSPSPNSSQKIIGWPMAPKTRFRWRTKRTRSRSAEREDRQPGGGATVHGGLMMAAQRQVRTAAISHRIGLAQAVLLARSDGRCGR